MAYDRSQGSLGRTRKAAPRATRDQTCTYTQARKEWTAVLELPDPVPITNAELHALETYLGKALDDLFG